MEIPSLAKLCFFTGISTLRIPWNSSLITQKDRWACIRKKDMYNRLVFCCCWRIVCSQMKFTEICFVFMKLRYLPKDKFKWFHRVKSLCSQSLYSVSARGTLSQSKNHECDYYRIVLKLTSNLSSDNRNNMHQNCPDDLESCWKRLCGHTFSSGLCFFTFSTSSEK